MIHFKLIFIYVSGVDKERFSLHVDIQLFLHYMLKRYSFPNEFPLHFYINLFKHLCCA